MDTDLTTPARELVDSTAYLVLGTVDEDGAPRVSPLYFGHDRYAALYWVSHPATHHSANVRRGGRVAATVYDSASVVGQGRALYLTGRAREVPDDELGERVGSRLGRRWVARRSASRNCAARPTCASTCWTSRAPRCTCRPVTPSSAPGATGGCR